MKLRNLAIFAIALSLPLAACGGGDDAAETDGTMSAESTMVAPAPMPAPMPADSGAMAGDSMSGMSHDTMGGMSHDSMADTTKM